MNTPTDLIHTCLPAGRDFHRLGPSVDKISGGALQIMYEDSKTIALTIDRFEGGRAILIGEREAEIIVPKRLVPKACGEGDVIHLTLASDKAETARKQQTAKELLNEILSGK